MAPVSALMERHYRPIIATLGFVVVFFAGCDDCEDTSVIKCFLEQNNDRVEKLGGIWRGTLTHSEMDGSQTIVAIVSETDDFRLISTDGIQASGKITAGRRNATGDLRFYPLDGETFSDERNTLSGTFEGSAKEATTLNGDWVASVDRNIKGSFHLTYDNVYADDSTLLRLAGNYSAQDGSGFSRSIVIQESGDIEGSDSDGCTYSGKAEIIDTNWNAYELTIAIADCDERSGDFAGLGFLDNNGSELTAQVTGGTAVLSFSINK